MLKGVKNIIFFYFPPFLEVERAKQVPRKGEKEEEEEGRKYLMGKNSTFIAIRSKGRERRRKKKQIAGRKERRKNLKISPIKDASC